MTNGFTRLLSRLSVGQKLLLIYLLDLTAVIFVSAILINEKYISIDFARKELAGNAYVHALRDGLVDLARVDGAAAPPAGNLSAHAASITRTEALLGEGLGSAEPSQALQQAVARIAIAPASAQPALIEPALQAGRELLTRVGNQSNLILDPDLDSYYAMSLVVLRYPELLEVLNGIGDRLRAHRLQDGDAQADARTRYLILEGRLDAVAHGIAADHAEAFAASSPALTAALAPHRDRVAAPIEAYRSAARTQIEGGASAPANAAVQRTRLELVDALGMAWAASGVELDRLLQARIDSLLQRMWLHLGTALFLLMVILVIVYQVARHIAAPLRHLSEVTDTVRRTGDHTLRAQWHSEDEIGRLVVGFNDMLAQLDRERESQKELAASARAAETERALVEATPLALVVTSIPHHEVLHSNTPAQVWLHGCVSDPGKRGLEPEVRARLFQQLADRDAVDEFEVRWTGGAEPTWAVLSARRVRYQGQDAMLTAFTPINHLKLMERRLELWAKVFEATTEGIVIVDAERHVLTANQAFSRATGHDLHDMVGDDLGLILSRPDGSEAQLAALWGDVQRRGTWQGELRVRRRNGTHYPAWLLVSPVRDARGGMSHLIVTSIDITDRKKSEERIRFLAEHDVLTGLPNRSLCVERLRGSMQRARRDGRRVAVLFIDLDHFKDINDSLGHHIGDAVLRSVARRLTEAVRGGDTVSRLGGDEFVVVLDQIDDAAEATLVVEQRLLPLLRQPHAVDGAELHVAASIGIALFPDDAEDLDALMRHADVAMYQTKAEGRNDVRFFDASMTARAQRRLTIETALRQALARDQFSLHFQPRVAARGRRVVGAEALLRWDRGAEGPALSPAHFIPVAEQCGLILPIGQWVIEQACRQLAQWRQTGLAPLVLSINLSAVQLRSDALIDGLRESLQRHDVPPGLLELELTESTLMDNAEAVLERLHRIRALGVGLSVDDFGTGYSSLGYLSRLPLQKLKVDRSFVQGMLERPAERAITLSVIGLGHTLGLTVVAEGVESEAQAQALQAAGCDELQGFLFARPLPVDEFERWFTQRPALVA